MSTVSTVPRQKNPDEKREKGLTFRLTATEYDQVREAIERSSLSGPDWLMAQLGAGGITATEGRLEALEQAVEKLQREVASLRSKSGRGRAATRGRRKAK